jgi:hypothetical protein
MRKQTNRANRQTKKRPHIQTGIARDMERRDRQKKGAGISESGDTDRREELLLLW